MKPDPRIGTELGGYRIEAVIGRGGMGIVYRAEQPYPQRNVALKLIASALADDDLFRERFLRETNAAAAIDHPNIIPIYDAGEAEGALYIAMRYVDGTDLRALLRKEGALDPGQASSIVDQIGSALDAAHVRGLVHRDVKPGNILVDRGAGLGGSDHCYLTDFGLTKRTASQGTLTRTGQLLGTVDYVAPEQIEGTPLDGRADVYSLGCVLHECLTARAPFRRETEMGILYAHLHEEPPRPSAARADLPPDLDRVVATALAKARDDRYPTCRALSEAVRAALTTHQPAVQPIEPGSATPTVRLGRPPARADRTTTAGAPQHGARRMWRVRALVAAAVAVLAILPLVSVGLALARRDQRAFPSAPASPPTALTPRELSRTWVDSEDVYAGIDIKNITIRRGESELTLVLTTYGEAPSGSVRLEIDTTGSLDDGCGGYDWRVQIDGEGSSLDRLQTCVPKPIEGVATGALGSRRTEIVLSGPGLPEALFSPFRWRLVTAGAGGGTDYVPSYEPVRFP